MSVYVWLFLDCKSQISIFIFCEPDLHEVSTRTDGPLYVCLMSPPNYCTYSGLGNDFKHDQNAHMI